MTQVVVGSLKLTPPLRRDLRSLEVISLTRACEIESDQVNKENLIRGAQTSA